MKRDYLKHLATTAALLLVTGSVNAHDAEIDGIYYNLVSKLKQASVTYQGTNERSAAYSGEVVIPSTIVYEGATYDVTSIGSSAFYDCTGLTSVTIPSSVTTIGEFAFHSCRRLTSLNIPEGVTSIDDGVFMECKCLTSISIPSSVTSISDFLFSDCSGLTSLTIPEGVTSIGKYAISGCCALTSLTIPEGVTSIGVYAFAGCSGLTSVTIPSNVTNIGSNTFYNCSGLVAVTIPEGVTSIGEYAFSGCSALAAVTIPLSVAGIGGRAFEGCTGLISITIEGRPSISSSRIFANCSELLDVYCYSETPPVVNSSLFEGSYIDHATLHVPSVALGLYAANPVWSSFKEIVTIDPIVIPTTIALTDGETFEGLGLERDMESITYTRTFSNTNWQGLYVPFTMEYSEWVADFDVARINDIHQFDDDDNGTIDRTELEVIKVTSGSIEANTPYLIRAKETGEKTFTLANRTLYKAEEKSYTVSSWNTLFTFTGTYSGVTGSDMVGNAYYALGDGVLRQAASTDNALSPYRWYVAITDRNGAQKGVNEVKLKVWGEDATGISPLSVSPEGRKTAVYDLSGRRVENPTKGLYIVNGKKMMVR